MGSMASQITSLTIVYYRVYSGADQIKHQSSASLAFVRGIHRWPVNSPHKWPVTRKMCPFDDAIMVLPDTPIWWAQCGLTMRHTVAWKIISSDIWRQIPNVYVNEYAFENAVYQKGLSLSRPKETGFHFVRASKKGKKARNWFTNQYTKLNHFRYETGTFQHI